MDFLCVGTTKLKVVLSEEECEKYNIRPKDGEYVTSEIRLALRRILDLAAEECAFRLGSERVLIQMYPCEGGGCELFITKLSSVGDRERRAITSSENLSTYQGREAVFFFDSLCSLILAAKTVRRPDVRCDVYRSDSGEYYVSFCENVVDGFSDFEQFSEFGTRLASLPTGIYGEWGRQIIKDKGFALLSKL